FGDIARVLRPGGVMSLQTGSVLDAHLIRDGRERLGALFADVTAYRLTMPSYHCGEYCFLAASLAPILSDPDAGRLTQVEAALRSRFTPAYWSQAVQRAAQALPGSFPCGGALRVAVVGAGPWGVRAAALREEGGAAGGVFEARDGRGGRLCAARPRPGVAYEAGGEWIDSDHHRIRRLLADLGHPARCVPAPDGWVELGGE